MQLNSKQIKLLMDIDDDYEQILNPPVFIKNFETLFDFRLWCIEGSVLDLEEVLVVFVYHELYEHCAIIRDVIEEKINDIETNY